MKYAFVENTDKLRDADGSLSHEWYIVEAPVDNAYREDRFYGRIVHCRNNELHYYSSYFPKNFYTYTEYNSIEELIAEHFAELL